MKYLRVITVFILLVVTSVIVLNRNQRPLTSNQSVSAQTPPECSATDTTNWCQVQRDAQRTGYTPEILPITESLPNNQRYQVVWNHPFQPEKVFPQVQAIIYQGKVFVGTEMGKLHALNATTGTENVWLQPFSAGGPILASVAADSGKIYFSSLDGAVYAVNANTGTQVWKKQIIVDRGFSTAPVFADNKIMLGGRDGKFYALDPSNGNILWQYSTGAAILQTAAYNNNRVFFGAMDMRVYALNTADGSLVWQSAELKASRDRNLNAMVGMAFKDYWPVVTQGKVIIRPAGEGNVTDLTVYAANPNAYSKTMYVFDETTGAETTVVHYDNPNMHGAVTPPCVDRDGYLIVPTSGWDTTPWGRLSLQTGTVFERFTSIYGEGTAGDENENVTCSNNLIFIFHTGEGPGAGMTGFYDLNSNPKIFTAVNFGKTNWEMTNNTQGGGGNPVSIANGLIYHISGHELVVRKTQ